MEEVVQFLTLAGQLPPGSKQLLLAYINCGGASILAHMTHEARFHLGECLALMASVYSSAAAPPAPGKSSLQRLRRDSAWGRF